MNRAWMIHTNTGIGSHAPSEPSAIATRENDLSLALHRRLARWINQWFEVGLLSATSSWAATLANSQYARSETILPAPLTR